MAKSYSLGVTNTTNYSGTTDSGHLDPVEILSSDYNYNKTGDFYLNSTVAMGSCEKIIKRSSRTQKPTWILEKGEGSQPDEKVPYKQGNVKLGMVLTATDSADATYRVDYPIECNITVRVPFVEGIDDSIVTALITRNLGAWVKPGTTSGTYQLCFADLIKGADSLPD